MSSVPAPSNNSASCCAMDAEKTTQNAECAATEGKVSCESLSRYPKMNQVHYNKESDRKNREIVSEAEWNARLRQQMLEEKALTHHKDFVTSLRQKLPWTEIRSDYIFEDINGKKVSFRDFFTNPKSDDLLMYVMMLPAGARDDDACPMCTFWVDNMSGNQYVLQQKTNIAVVAKGGPHLFGDLVKKRSWRSDLPLFSAQQNTFLEDLGTSLTQAQFDQFKGLITEFNGNRDAALNKLREINPSHPNVRANFGEGFNIPLLNIGGIFVFHLDRATNKIYKTFEDSGRGGERMNAGFGLMDLLPNGRENFFPSL